MDLHVLPSVPGPSQDHHTSPPNRWHSAMQQGRNGTVLSSYEEHESYLEWSATHLKLHRYTDLFNGDLYNYHDCHPGFIHGSSRLCHERYNSRGFLFIFVYLCLSIAWMESCPFPHYRDNKETDCSYFTCPYFIPSSGCVTHRMSTGRIATVLVSTRLYPFHKIDVRHDTISVNELRHTHSNALHGWPTLSD